MKKGRPHNWAYPVSKRCPWNYCVRCGLIWLKNDASNKAAKKPCPDGDDE